MGIARRADDAEAQAERIASLIFMAGRGGQIAFSALMLANDWRRYGRPLLQAAALSGIVVESAWLSRRLIRRRGYDDRLGVWVDCLSAAAALLISQRGLGTQGAAPWAKNVAIGAAIGAASTRRVSDTVGTVGALCAAAIVTGLRAGGRDAHVAGIALSVNDAVSWTGTHAAARSYLTAHRRYARLRDEADALAVERAAAAAAEAERGSQQELLHHVTVDVLSAIVEGSDFGSGQAAARREAARLRHALRTGGLVQEGLQQALAGIVETAAGQGMRVELVTAELGEVGGTEAAAAVAQATRRALEAAQEYGGADRVVVRAVTANGTATVTVRDHGLGFQLGTGTEYESKLLTIRDLLEAAGGEVAIWSEPGNGARVTMEITAPFEPSQQQRRPGGETREAAQFGELPALQTRYADRTLLTALLAWRATGLLTGAAALVAGYPRYRHRGLAFALLLVAGGESVWYARRALRGDRWSDPTGSRADAATALGIVLLGHVNLQPADRSTWINWPPWTFGANVICGQAMGVTSAAQAIAGAAAVIGAHATHNRRARDALADSMALSAFFSVARLLAVRTRDSAVRLEQARARAEAQGRRLAEAREGSAQLRVLHDHALQTLEAIANGWIADLDLVKSHARDELARLRRELRDTSFSGQSFGDLFGTVLAGHAALRIECECSESPDIPRSVILAFCGAVDEALTNVRKHARTSLARVTVSCIDGIVTVTIADEGVGFDQFKERGGFGLRESIQRRMRDAGGTAGIESAPGIGTRITLSWPA